MTAVLKNRFNNTPSMEELVFANRNKAYGAYVLKKMYPRNLMIAFWLAVTIFTGSVTTPLLLRSHSGESGIRKLPTGGIILENLTQLGKEIKQISIDDLSKLIPKVSTFKYMAPLVRPDEKVVEEYTPDVSMLKNAIPGMVTRKGNDAGVDVTLLDIKEPVNTDIVKDNTEANTVFNWVEEMPRYSEGEDALLTFLMENIRYPELARRVGVEGKVIVNFTVEKSGNLGNLKVIKSIGGGCDEEALRVVALTAGKWIAGKQNGKAVKVNISIPIVFKLRS